MIRLPVIVGFGGINAAGRSSGHHGFRRMVIDALPSALAAETWQSLASLMQLDVPAAGPDHASIDYIRGHTLVRRIEPALFDSGRIPWNRPLRMRPDDGHSISFIARANQLPMPVPETWRVTDLGGGDVRVAADEELHLLMPASRASEVTAAGQLPTGFDPRTLYQARNHPRGLQMTVFGASDAIHSLGFDWEQLRQLLPPDQISVYAGSGMGQLDSLGNGGMLNSRAMGKRVTSKQCPLGFAEMPADFINAYILGSVGGTGTSMGACASFLYNLRSAVSDIQTGRARAVLVGNAEAPVTPEIIEGYAAMGALATDAELLALDGLSGNQEPDYRRACRPFADNCGFTIAESAQFLILVDDELAMELGANIHGAVTDVFINADGYKKSISSPGVGNYITVAKAMAAARGLLGDDALRRRSLVMAHGTGTPQNRVTESRILNELARCFGIERWPVAAIKCFIGHSIGAAAADQLVATLGAWRYGIIPGIATIDAVAEDVHDSHLAIGPVHQSFEPDNLDLAVINAKGFGGNNASAMVIAPQVVRSMLGKRYGVGRMGVWQQQNEAVADQMASHDRQMTEGRLPPIYRFDHGVLGDEDVELSADHVRLSGFPQDISLALDSLYRDMV